MRIRRRRLRSALVLVGCLVGDVPFVGGVGETASTAADPGAAALASDGSGLAGGAADAIRLAVALLLIVGGSALHLWSKGCLEQNQRLVTSGPYRFTRNPFYLANGLVDLGLCALIGRVWVAGPYLVLWWLAYRETIAREEARLRALFPEQVGRYFGMVPRLIPNGHVLPRAEAIGRFTFDNPALACGSEYARILGFFVAAAAIVASAWLRARGGSAFADEHAVGLALVLLVPVGWVAKLALAEAFRRPETALLPFAQAPFVRVASIAVALVAMASLSIHGGGRRWLIAAPVLWAALAALDQLAVVRLRRVRPDAASARERWRVFPRVFLAALALGVAVECARAMR